MTKEELIMQCRYYGGESENPYTETEFRWFWDMERVYVEHGGNFYGEAEYYHNIKGKKYKGIPFNLLMVMFTGWGKNVEDIKAHIEEFYDLMNDYLGFVSDELPADKIPR